MIETLLGLSTAYIFLLAVLLLALIFSRLHWSLKAVLICVAVGFYWLSYQGWKDTQGWPAEAKLPQRFLLHFAVIEEPDEELATDGNIFLWLSDLKDMQPADQPRAYRLEYDKGTHSKVADALREMQNGNLQIGQVSPSSHEAEKGKKKKRIGHKYLGLEFVKLPDTALPEK